MSVFLSYRDPSNLFLNYGKVIGLVCTVELPGIKVVVSRHSTAAPVSVRIYRQFETFWGASWAV